MPNSADRPFRFRRSGHRQFPSLAQGLASSCDVPRLGRLKSACTALRSQVATSHPHTTTNLKIPVPAWAPAARRRLFYYQDLDV
eukprot:11107244-Alexandrium_andersonii.AAC.1